MHNPGLPAHGSFTNLVKFFRQGMQPFRVKPRAGLGEYPLPAQILESLLRFFRRVEGRIRLSEDQEAAILAAWRKCQAPGKALSPGHPDWRSCLWRKA